MTPALYVAKTSVPPLREQVELAGSEVQDVYVAAAKGQSGETCIITTWGSFLGLCTVETKAVLSFGSTGQVGFVKGSLMRMNTFGRKRVNTEGQGDGFLPFAPMGT